MAEKFVKVTKDILSRGDLTPATKLVYAAIVDRIGDNGSSWPGVRRIAADCGVGGATVCDSIKSLVAVGLLKVAIGSGGKTNTYTIGRSDSERSETEHQSALGNQNKGARFSEQGRSEIETSALGFQNETRPSELDPHNQTQRTKPKAATRRDCWAVACSFMADSTFQTPEFEAAWREWDKHRREIRKPLTTTTIKRQIADLTKHPVAKAVSIIETSIKNGWTGLFPESRNGNGNHRPAARGTPKYEEQIDVKGRLLNA